MFVNKRSLKLRWVSWCFVGLVLNFTNFNMASGQSVTDKDALPIKVGSTVLYVVPVAKLPDPMRRGLQGKSAFAVVEGNGRLVTDKNIIYHALISFVAAKVAIDDPISPGWDTKRAKRTAEAYQNVADALRRVRIKQNLVALSDEVAQLGARLFVLSIVPQDPFSAVDSFAKALLEPIADPKQLARVLLSADITVAELGLRSVAYKLEQVSDYPIDSDLAFGIITADVMYGRMGPVAALARIDIEESDPLWAPIKTALNQLKSTLLSRSSSGIIRLTSDVYDLGKRIFDLLKQTKAMGPYLRVREKMVKEWYSTLINFQRMSENIAFVARSLK